MPIAETKQKSSCNKLHSQYLRVLTNWYDNNRDYGNHVTFLVLDGKKRCENKQ